MLMKVAFAAVLIMVSSLAVAWVNAAETIYFLVAELESTSKENRHNDSYVLPLTKQEDIDYARYLIQQNQVGFKQGDRTIVGAWAMAGNEGINRNYLDPKFPEWSWQVRFGAFAEIMAEVYDGNPSWVENHVDWTFYGGEYKIGFWGYTVVRELGPVPLYLSIIPERRNLQFYWSGVGTNYVYTLECKESLASKNWLPLLGASWPLKTNHWTLPLTNTTTRFYRVKAEPTQQ